MQARFESIGAHFPERVVTTEERISSMARAPHFDMKAITGIESVRVARADEDCLSAALSAARDCLARSRYAAEDLDMVISCSITRFIDGEQRNFVFEPPLSLYIKEQLGATKAIYFDVSNACAGMFTGVLLLERMIKAGTIKNGIVVSGEYITCISDTAAREITDPFDPQFGSMTVGDSGAAVILDDQATADDVIHYYELMTCAEYSHLCIGMPSNQNSNLALYTNNAEMHKKDRIQLWPRFQMDYYQTQGTDLEAEGFDHIIHHQVGLKAVQNFNRYGGQYFDATMPEPLNVLSELGNTATTSHFLVLYRALQANTLRKGEKVLLVPAASGVVTGFLSATISSLEV